MTLNSQSQFYQRQELWSLIGISTKSIILGTEIASKKNYKSPTRPTTGRYASIIKERDKLLHKSSFLSHRIYDEGLCYVHRIKKLSKQMHISPYRNNEKDCQVSVGVFQTNPLPQQNIAPRNNIQSSKINSKRRNQSQQTLLIESINNSYHEISENQSTPINKNIISLDTKKIKSKKKMSRAIKNTHIKISGWENEIENI